MTEKTVTTAALKAALKVGATNGQSVNSLVFSLGTTERAIRNLVDELIEEGVPVCAHPKTGYYIAGTFDEIKSTHDFLRARALHGLVKARKLKDAWIAHTNIPSDFNDEPIPEF